MVPEDFGTSLVSSSHENVRNKESFPKMQEHRMSQIDDYTTAQSPSRGSVNKGEYRLHPDPEGGCILLTTAQSELTDVRVLMLSASYG